MVTIPGTSQVGLVDADGDNYFDPCPCVDDAVDQQCDYYTHQSAPVCRDAQVVTDALKSVNLKSPVGEFATLQPLLQRLTLLQDTDPESILLATTFLTQGGDARAYPALLEKFSQIEKMDPAVQTAVYTTTVMALQSAGGRNAVPLFLRELDNTNDPVRLLVLVGVLATLKDSRAKQQLENLVLDVGQEWPVRSVALAALGEIGGVAAVVDVVDVFDNVEDGRLRMVAARVLDILEDPRGVKALGQLLQKETDPELIGHIASGLIAIGTPAAATAFLDGLAKELESAFGNTPKRYAIVAAFLHNVSRANAVIGQIVNKSGPPKYLKATKYLDETMTSDEQFLGMQLEEGENSQFCKAIAAQLVRIGNQPAASALLEGLSVAMLTNNLQNRLKIEAIGKAVNAAGATMEPLLLHEQKQGRLELRQAATLALGFMGTTASATVRNRLVAALSDAEEAIRMAAIPALFMMIEEDDPKALAKLKELMKKDPSELVQHNARYAMGIVEAGKQAPQAKSK